MVIYVNNLSVPLYFPLYFVYLICPLVFNKMWSTSAN